MFPNEMISAMQKDIRYFCWGVQKDIFQTKNKQHGYIDGICLTVNGRKHDGRVWIFCDAADDLTVVLTARDGTYHEETDIHRGICLENLMDVIDSLIEN